MTTTTRKTLKARVEELQARRRENRTADKHKWMHKPRILQHVKTAEMVSLDRDSDFAKIPAELQLDVISHLNYEDVLSLKRTGRYFNYFINSDVIKESKAAQIETFKLMESKPSTASDKLPCYRCLKLKLKSEYYDVAGNFYLNNCPYSYYRPTQSHTPNYDRHCIRCSFITGKYNPGTKLITQGVTWMVCSSCGVLTKDVSPDSYRFPSANCRPCGTEYNLNRAVGTILRLMQWVIAIVILPLACKGKFMPWTSKADVHSLRFIFTITLDLLTIGATLGSMFTRMQSRQSNKRSENGKFVFAVEFTAFACWTGILAAIFIEANGKHYAGRYDRFAKGLTGLVVIECLLFFITSFIANRYSRELLFPSTRRRKGASMV